MADKGDESEGMGPGRQPRPPSLLDALLPIVVLIALIALTIAFFGGDATNGPLQVALFLSAAFASLIFFSSPPRNRTPWGAMTATRPSGATQNRPMARSGASSQWPSPPRCVFRGVGK